MPVDMPAAKFSGRAHALPLVVIWTDVGRQLRARRIELGWSATEVTRHGGPNYKTVLKAERGQISQAALVDRHAQALDLDVAELLRRAVGLAPALNGDALKLVRSFERCTAPGRRLLLAIAAAVAQS
jgi:hypothetical protein